jgi:hypothetical protein
LIKSAELNSILTEARQYKTAIYAFKLKYNALPGDMNNAQSYWPGCTDGPLDCNGNGNGDWNSGEPFRVWEHLSLSGIIPGQFDGSGIFTGKIRGILWTVTDATSPQGKYPGSMWTSGYTTSTINSLNDNINGIMVGLYNGSTGIVSGAGSMFTASDALNLDTKSDDGWGTSGKIRAIHWGAAGFCKNTTSGEYTGLSADSPRCNLLFDIE